MLDFLRHASTPPSDLIGIIRYVRARWRAKLAVKGAVRLLAVSVAIFFALAYTMQWARFSPASILSSRILLAVAFVTSAYFFLVRPLRRQVTDEQVALYLEEKEPSLQTMLVSAVESNREGRHWESTALVRKLIEQAVEVCARADAPRRAEHGPLRMNGAVFASIITAALLALLLGPAFFRHALSAVLLVSRSVEAPAAPYKIAVTPGNASVPKGADETITAHLDGFNADDVVVMVRREPTSPFEKQPLIHNDKGNFEGILFWREGRHRLLLRRSRGRALAGLHAEGRRRARTSSAWSLNTRSPRTRDSSRKRSKRGAISRCFAARPSTSTSSRR